MSINIEYKLFPIAKKNHYGGYDWGFMDKAGKVIFEPTLKHYHLVISQRAGIAEFVNDRLLWGCIDDKGEMVVVPQYKNIGFFSEELCKIETTEGKIGFINKSGDVIIQPKFTHAEYFSEGLCSTYKAGEKKWFYIDRRGESVLGVECDWAYPFSDGFAKIRKGKKHGYINKNGELVIPFKFELASGFKNGCAQVLEKLTPNKIPQVMRVKDNEKSSQGLWGLINEFGDYLITPQFEYIQSNYSSGWLMDEEINWGDADVYMPLHHEISASYEDFFRIKKDGKFGFMNEEGRIVIQPQFDGVGRFQDGQANIAVLDKKAYMSGNSYSPDQYKFGFIDKKGKISIEPHFDGAKHFSGAMAGVKIENKWGFINIEGHVVITPKYDYFAYAPGIVLNFLNNLALVCREGKLQYIDKDERVVWREE